MGYTHHWKHTRAFTNGEWKMILGETKRIVAKAARGEYYTGKEDAASEQALNLDEQGFRHGFKEGGAWRSFPHPELPIPHRDRPILLAGPRGTGKPRLTMSEIVLNGKCPLNYETFRLGKEPPPYPFRREPDAMTAFCKTEYRPYDAVVVSILAVAQHVAPDAILVRSDGGPDVIRYLF
jgi:hypothetical protein